MLTTSLWKTKPGDRKIPGIWVYRVHENVLGRSVIFFPFLSFFYFLREGKKRYKYKLEISAGGNETRWKLSDRYNFQFGSPNLTCHQLAPQNLKWLRKSMKKASVWSPGLQRPQSLNYISWTYALFKALTTEEQRKQSGFSLQDLKLMCTWHGFFMWLSFQNSYTETLSCCCLCPGASHRLLPRSPTVPVVNDPDTVAHQGAILTPKDSPTSGSRLSRQRILN